MPYKVGDAVFVRTREGWVVNPADTDWWDEHKITIIKVGVQKWTGHRDYICVVNGDAEYRIKGTERADDRFLRTHNLEKRWLRSDMLTVGDMYIVRVEECHPWGKCSRCDTIVEYVEEPNYVCYACKSNPHPAWSTRNIVDPDDD